MRRTFFDHQFPAWEYAKRRKTLALFMEMRLGKTLVAIRWANTRPHNDTVLVVAPLNVLPVWRAELEDEGYPSVILHGSMEKRLALLNLGLNDGVKWFLVNPEGLYERGQKTPSGKAKVIPSPIAQMGWDTTILDESTFIRIPTSIITNIAIRYLHNSRYRAILTGLPDPEGEQDFVTQFIYLRGSFMGCRNFYEWRHKFQQVVVFDWVPKKGTLKKLSSEVKSHSFSLTRKKAGVGGEKIRVVKRVELPEEVMETITHLRKYFEIGENLTNNILTVRMWEQRITGGSAEATLGIGHDTKREELYNILTRELRGEQVIVWCRFTAEILALQRMLRRRDLPVLTVYGAIPLADREDRLRTFKQDRVSILVAQTKTLQMGVDWSVANAEIYFSNWPDFEVRAQSEDRPEHPTKREKLLIFDIVAKDTVDEILYDSLQAKDARTFKRTLNRGYNFKQQTKK